MRKLIVIALTLLLFANCRTKQPVDHQHAHMTAAKRLTELCQRSQLRGWNVQATAAGDDCSVLYVRMSVTLEDPMVESLHYGSGAYAIAPGGIQRLSQEGTFRGVAYKDVTGEVWTYGNVLQSEAETLVPCR